MSIVTKKGDEGKTGLLGGQRVSKYHPKVECYGDIDELIAFLGLAKVLIDDEDMVELVENIQKELMTAATEIASDAEKAEKLTSKINSGTIKKIDDKILYYENSLTPIKEFVIPGKDLASSCLHLSRTVARRAERKIAKLVDDNLLKNKELLVFMNRLSDLLFTMARKIETQIDGS
jgi:cob(I)alamin adenosyltransferase